MRTRFIAAVLTVVGLNVSHACDLCAVYRSADVLWESGAGVVASIAEQYIPYGTSQVDGEVVHPANPDHLNSSITHFVPTYNFSSWFGVSVNVPLTHLEFKRTDIAYSLSGPPVVYTEHGTETGLGDVSLIGRLALLQKVEMDYGVWLNLLAGVKFPTGNSDRIADEMNQTAIFDALVPPGTPHDPLGHSIASVHEHSLALGSGSYDGIFGLTTSASWKRWFVNAQFQYYVRTEGESGFAFGNELIVSGGPGFYVLLEKQYTLSLQAFAAYDSMARDTLSGTASDRTGMTAWYLGPFVNLTWGSRFTANVGIDLPLHVANNGYQVVPDYRLHGGVSWRF